MNTNNSLQTDMKSIPRKKDTGWGKILLGILAHILFGAILVVAYIFYLASRIDSLDFTYIPINIGLWFLTTVLPFLIVGSFLLFFLFRTKIRFLHLLIIGGVIEIILAALLPISDELSHAKLERYGKAQNEKIIEERVNVLPAIITIDGCPEIETFTVWKECVQKNLKTREDFENCKTQEWEQFRDATEYGGDVSQAAYYSDEYRQRTCQETYNPIGAAAVATIEDCFDLGGAAWQKCFEQTVRTEADFATCKSLAGQPSGYVHRECYCNQAWAVYKKEVTLCQDDSCPASSNNQCTDSVMTEIAIVDVFEQCSRLSDANLRHRCVIPAITQIKNDITLRKKYDGSVGKDLCSLFDESNPFGDQARAYCVNLPK